MGDVDERSSFVFPSDRTERATGSRFERDDVLFARITPCLENGKTALVKFLGPGTMGIGSTEFIVLRGNVVGPAFTYCAARSDALRQHAIKSMTGASGRQRVARTAFDSVELVEPTAAVAHDFEGRAGPLLDLVFALAKQNRSLARTRDLLMPRLVSGQIDVSQVELGDLLGAEAA
jgi:type I restriction enzyme S subunit